MLKKKILIWWYNLIGDPNHFTLEVRIFHCICLIMLFVVALNIPFNSFIGLPDLSLLMTTVLIVVFFTFYLSRYKKQTVAAIILSQILYHILLAINYYYNSGINGPTYLLFMVSLIFTVITVPKKQLGIWISVNVILILILLLSEKNHFTNIENTYLSSENRFADLSYSYILSAILVSFILVYIINAYNHERKRSDLKAAELEKSDTTKNKLLSIIAHDLKDPLISIQSFLELITQYDLGAAEKESIEKELLIRTENAVQMLGNILTWSKSQMDGVQVNLTDMAVLQTLSKTLDITKAIASDKGIELVHDLTDEYEVKGDPDMLQLVLRNVIINAIKFSHPADKITVSVSVNNQICTISVKDEGVGIPLTKQADLFLLGKGITYGTGKEKGAGLGLVLCKNYMEQQGGTINFISEIEKGTTFFINLPLSMELQKSKNLKLNTV